MTYAYDDQQCPKRGPGLTHRSNYLLVCIYCGIVAYSAKKRPAAPDPATLPPPVSNPHVCNFSTCKATVLIRAWIQAWRTIDAETSLLEAEREETWLCIHHSELVKLAKKKKLQIRRSLEGWLYIDNLEYVLFST